MFNNRKGLKAVIYVRVSTMGQVDGASLDEQERQCRKACDFLGHNLVRVYREEGESGASEDRTQLQKLMKDAEQGLFQIVIVYSPDRFSRSFRVMMNTYYKLREDMPEPVHLYITNYNIDTSTDIGHACFQMFSTFAEMDRKNIKQRMDMGKEAKLKAGAYISRKPYGYIVSDDGKLFPHPEEAEIVKEIFKLRAYRGLSYRRIAGKLNEKNVTAPNGGKWNHGTVSKIVKKPLYKGVFIYNEEIIPTDYKPIITPQEFGRAN
ncbi:recombinase family protein [Agaribacter marinus]|uniref:Recombinase family protein n=1 Tax=Virgibacillus salarius TaxID=447199 RepID=A0A941DXL6_9BACI|nr:recombinase family protein [Virgibacillus salarius]MBR7796979.1 recombinase family protein [Virgibacillus salarius]NAZ09689.1 recombinase family protein [Agaribacter marinus]